MKIIIFTAVKYCCILHGRVFVMQSLLDFFIREFKPLAIIYCCIGFRERGGLVVRVLGLRSERLGVRSSRGSPCCVLEQDTIYFRKVLVIPRKRWLHPDMTEKLFTWTLSKKRNETKCIGLCLTWSETQTRTGSTHFIPPGALIFSVLKLQ